MYSALPERCAQKRHILVVVLVDEAWTTFWGIIEELVSESGKPAELRASSSFALAIPEDALRDMARRSSAVRRTLIDLVTYYSCVTFPRIQLSPCHLSPLLYPLFKAIPIAISVFPRPLWSRRKPKRQAIFLSRVHLHHHKVDNSWTNETPIPQWRKELNANLESVAAQASEIRDV